MAYKPMPLRMYLEYIKFANWSIVKGSIDWKLLNENGYFICSIKIAHSKNTKNEVVASSVKKTENEFKKRGLKWPPKKK